MSCLVLRFAASRYPVGDIKSINKIALYEGWLLDGFEITYVMADNSLKVANHLGSAKPNVTIEFNTSEVLVGLTGKVGLPGYYENKKYLNSVTLVILDKQTGKSPRGRPPRRWRDRRPIQRHGLHHRRRDQVFHWA